MIDVDDEADPHYTYTIESIYGKNFFFQQRRGRLDLRRLSQLDLDRVVRNVDVDVLQNYLENITFCKLGEEDLRFLTDPLVIKLFRVAQLIIEYLLYAQEQLASNLNALAAKYTIKKRALAEKRRELAELKESTKYFKSQIRSKRNNIATLEELIRNAGSKKAIKKKRAQPLEETSTDVIKFFVSGPEGLCVEFNERGSLTIVELAKLVEQAFVSRRSGRYLGEQPQEVKLVHQGKILIEGHGTLAENNIKNGDTLLALLSKDQELTPAPVPQQPVIIQSPPIDTGAGDLKAFLAAQQQMLATTAKEMRDGWEKALLLLQQRQNLPSEGEDKWLVLEKSLRAQLDAQLEYYEKRLGESKGQALVYGNLQDDDDEELRRAKERIARLEEQLAWCLAELEKLKRPVAGGSINITEHHSTSYSTSSMNAKKDFSIKTSHSTAAPAAASKIPSPTQTAASFSFSEAPMTVGRPIRTTSLKVKRSGLKKFPRIEQLPAPPAANYPEMFKPVVGTGQFITSKFDGESSHKPKREVGEGEVLLVFPYEYNPDLYNLLVRRRMPREPPLDEKTGNSPQVIIGSDDVAVVVRDYLTVDDLVFELRRRIADKGKIPLARVELNFDSRTVRLALDLDEEIADSMTPQTFSEYAEVGRLQIRITQGEVLTDTQIDVLVAEWEKQQLQEPADVLNLSLNRSIDGRLPTEYETSMRKSLVQKVASEKNVDKLRSSKSKLNMELPAKPVPGIMSSAYVRRMNSLKGKPSMHAPSKQVYTGVEKLGNIYARDGMIFEAREVESDLSDDDMIADAKSSRRSDESKGKQIGSKKSTLREPSRSSGLHASSQHSSRRSWDEGNDDAVAATMEELYSELDNTLSGLSESDGLTDDELKMKMRALRKSTSRLPENITNQIGSFRNSVTEIVSTAIDGDPDTVMEFNEEFLDTVGGRESRDIVTMSIKADRMVEIMSAKDDVGIAGSKKYDYKLDSYDFKAGSSSKSRKSSDSAGGFMRLSLGSSMRRRSIDSQSDYDFDDEGYGYARNNYSSDDGPLLASVDMNSFLRSTVGLSTDMGSIQVLNNEMSAVAADTPVLTKMRSQVKFKDDPEEDKDVAVLNEKSKHRESDLKPNPTTRLSPTFPVVLPVEKVASTPQLPTRQELKPEAEIQYMEESPIEQSLGSLEGLGLIESDVSRSDVKSTAFRSLNSTASSSSLTRSRYSHDNILDENEPMEAEKRKSDMVSISKPKLNSKLSSRNVMNDDINLTSEIDNLGGTGTSEALSSVIDLDNTMDTNPDDLNKHRHDIDSAKVKARANEYMRKLGNDYDFSSTANFDETLSTENTMTEYSTLTSTFESPVHNRDRSDGVGTALDEEPGRGDMTSTMDFEDSGNYSTNTKHIDDNHSLAFSDSVIDEQELSL